MSSPAELPSEQTVILTFKSGDTVVVTPENSVLYTFFGDAAMYDHVYIELPKDSQSGDVEFIPDGTNPEDEAEATLTAAYIFRNEPAFEAMVSFMITNDFPQFLYSRRVPEHDKDVYWAKQLYEFGDTATDTATPEQ